MWWLTLPQRIPSSGANSAINGNLGYTAAAGTDTAVKSSSGYGMAFGSSLPSNGEGLNGGPGQPSGTWRYYSINYGRTHVIVLDSMTTRSINAIPWDPTVGIQSYAAPSQSLPNLPAAHNALYIAAGMPSQMEWLAADLAAVAVAAATDFIVVSYHHPSYSAGSHNSNTEIEMIEMRTLYNPILEAGGADICFHGHSHGYERMLPTVGFTGNSSTFVKATMVPNGYTAGTGNTPSLFVKPAGITANSGTTYVVAGSGGQYSSATASNYRFVSRADSVGVENNAGSISLDINGTTLTMTFIASGFGEMAAGQIGDVFTICKGPTCPTASNFPTQPAKTADTIVYVSYGDWGWSPSGNNSLLLNAAAAACSSTTTSATFNAGGCIGNTGFYTNQGYAQLSQQAVANAIGSACQAYGGCDFLMNTGDKCVPACAGCECVLLSLYLTSPPPASTISASPPAPPTRSGPAATPRFTTTPR